MQVTYKPAATLPKVVTAVSNTNVTTKPVTTKPANIRQPTERDERLQQKLNPMRKS